MISEEKNQLVYRAARVIAEKHKIKLSVAITIVRSQFEFVADNFRRGTMQGILLPGLGTFAVKPGRLVLYDQRRNIRLQRKNDLKKHERSH